MTETPIREQLSVPEQADVLPFCRNTHQVINERSKGRYNFPLVDIRKVPPELIQSINTATENSGIISQEDVQATAASLIIETMLQIAEARPRGPGVYEEIHSLEAVFRVVGEGAKVLQTLLDNKPDTVKKALQVAIARRAQPDKPLQELKPDQVVQETTRLAQYAHQKVGRMYESITAYGRR